MRNNLTPTKINHGETNPVCELDAPRHIAYPFASTGRHGVRLSEMEQQPESTLRKRSLKPLVFRALLLLLLLLPLECTARLFWVARGTPFLTAQRRIYRSFYPNVAEVERNPPAAEDDCFDVLLLGGSVLHSNYGDIEHLLRERLIRASGRCVKVHNVSAPAHTSLDSLYKYTHLSKLPFDLVVVYHGINETRANNCPSSVFRDDYSHLSWYRLINRFERKADARWFALPYTTAFVVGKIADKMGWSGCLPTHRPSKEALEFGCDVKTAAPFRRNLQGILELAQQRSQPVLLMSFAYHSPAEYSEERFDGRTLDYTVHASATELWGKQECVVAALDLQNATLQELIGEFPGSSWVDQNGLIPKQGEFFNDICHFTHEGSERFVENLLPAVLPLLSGLR